jgi:hypothetical protein
VPRHVPHQGGRLVLLLASLVVVALVLADTALAAWQPGGGGRAYSQAGAVAAGNSPTTTVSGRDVMLAWSASGGTVPIDGYMVSRRDPGGEAQPVGPGCAGVIMGLGCTETGVAPGRWTYTVTPVRNDWHGAQSPESVPIAVEAPSLTLGARTIDVLPATLSGQIAGFLEGQTVSFRLDDPTDGQFLSGSIVPASVPTSGGATVSVTLPAGTSDGVHTVYAIGSQGDVAAATVEVEAACSSPGTQAIGASKDSYVDSLLAGQNFGTATTLEVGPAQVLVLAQQRALVGFELPAIPARCTLRTATLRLYATKPAGGRTIEALQLNGAWTETGVNWSNQPSTTGTAATSASLGAAGWQEWNVLGQVEAMYGGVDDGFLIKDSVDSAVLSPHQSYQGREGTPDGQDPQLVLDFE